jgi:CRP/FNR family transcriptional regulator
VSRPDPQWLSAFPALVALDDPVARRVLTAAQVVELPAGETMFRAGDACQHYVMVLAGSIRVQKVGESGREIVLYRVERGQTCVLTTSCLFAATPYSAEGVTETPLSAAVLSRADFNEAIAGSAGFRRFVFAAFGERIDELMALIEAIAFGRVDKRLAERLLALADRTEARGARHGSRACAFANSAAVITLTHQQLATELGTAREVVSRLLKEFERRGWVALTRGEIAIRDRAALERLAAG